MTYGELNAMADIYGNVEQLRAAEPAKLMKMVRFVRQQSLDRLRPMLAKLPALAEPSAPKSLWQRVGDVVAHPIDNASGAIRSAGAAIRGAAIPTQGKPADVYTQGVTKSDKIPDTNSELPLERRPQRLPFRTRELVPLARLPRQSSCRGVRCVASRSSSRIGQRPCRAGGSGNRGERRARRERFRGSLLKMREYEAIRGSVNPLNAGTIIREYTTRMIDAQWNVDRSRRPSPGDSSPKWLW